MLPVEEKLLLQKFGLKKVLEKFMLTVNYLMNISQMKIIKCKLQDHLKLLINLQNMM